MGRCFVEMVDVGRLEPHFLQNQRGRAVVAEKEPFVRDDQQRQRRNIALHVAKLGNQSGVLIAGMAGGVL